MRTRWIFNGVEYDSWADMRIAQLNAKGRDNWEEEDWESYHYIHQVYFEMRFYDE